MRPLLRITTINGGYNIMIELIKIMAVVVMFNEPHTIQVQNECLGGFVQDSVTSIRKWQGSKYLISPDTTIQAKIPRSWSWQDK